MNNFRERENEVSGQKIRSTDYELAKATDRASDLAKIAESRDFELRRTSEAVEAAQAELNMLKDQNARQSSDNSVS